jgi:hypothetical protein
LMKERLHASIDPREASRPALPLSARAIGRSCTRSGTPRSFNAHSLIVNRTHAQPFKYHNVLGTLDALRVSLHGALRLRCRPRSSVVPSLLSREIHDIDVLAVAGEELVAAGVGSSHVALYSAGMVGARAAATEHPLVWKPVLELVAPIDPSVWRTPRALRAPELTHRRPWAAGFRFRDNSRDGLAGLIGPRALHMSISGAYGETPLAGRCRASGPVARVEFIRRPEKGDKALLALAYRGGTSPGSIWNIDAHGLQSLRWFTEGGDANPFDTSDHVSSTVGLGEPERGAALAVNFFGLDRGSLLTSAANNVYNPVSAQLAIGTCTIGPGILVLDTQGAGRMRVASKPRTRRWQRAGRSGGQDIFCLDWVEAHALYAGCRDGGIMLYDARSSRAVPVGRTEGQGSVTSLKPLRDGRRVVVQTIDGCIGVYDRRMALCDAARRWAPVVRCGVCPPAGANNARVKRIRVDPSETVLLRDGGWCSQASRRHVAGVGARVEDEGGTPGNPVEGTFVEVLCLRTGAQLKRLVIPGVQRANAFAWSSGTCENGVSQKYLPRAFIATTSGVREMALD